MKPEKSITTYDALWMKAWFEETLVEALREASSEVIEERRLILMLQ